MIHYSCDRCRRVLSPDEPRYVLRLEIHRSSGTGAELQDDVDERDYLLELHEILETAEDPGDDSLGYDVDARQRHDLCSHCYQRFINDPLGMDANPQLNFSEN